MNIIKEIDELIKTKISIISNSYRLFKLEAKLAGLSLFPLLTYLALLIPAATMIWLTLMALTAYFLQPITQNFLEVILILLLINISLLGAFLYQIKRYLNQMSFLKTRQNLAIKD